MCGSLYSLERTVQGMKKKISKQLDKAVKKRRCCYTLLKFDPVWYNLIMLGRGKNMVIAAFDEDFAINGYKIFPVSQLCSIESKGKKYNSIMKAEGITENISIPDIDLSSIRSVCGYFKDRGSIIAVEGDDFYFAGRIARAGKKNVDFEYFDCDGEWFPAMKIKYSDIAVITCGGRYENTFAKYAKGGIHRETRKNQENT